MKTRKKGQGGVSALIFILGSIILVGAAASNVTNNSFTIDFNESLNVTINVSVDNESNSDTVVDESGDEGTSFLNETSMGDASENQSLGGITGSVILNDTVNLTNPMENATLENQTINIPVVEDESNVNGSLGKKPKKSLPEIVETHKSKLNKETEDYLKAVIDKKESRDFIVKFRNSVDKAKLENVSLEKEASRFKLAKVEGKIEDIEGLIEDEDIEFLELDQDVGVLEDNIPFNIGKIKANTAWNLSKGAGVKVAVLDTGIASHLDLDIAGGYSVVSGDYLDSNGHGTAVAGVIAALLNDEGLVGASPDVSLYSVKIMDGSTGDLSNAISGIEWAIENNMDIVSMSFGFSSYSQIFKDVLEEAYDDGILLVAASGNEGAEEILYPAKYSSVIAVGATTENDELASFSSYGFEQELVAPGVTINSTSLGNSYSILSGTSMSAPHVAGVAALIKSFNHSLTNVEIRNKLRNDALDLGAAGKDDFFGYGLVQVNLESTNITFFNESYFYKIFNITNFRLPNQSYWFWLDGTGTIDDVDFMPGYYLVNITYDDGRKKSNVYNVSENGSIFLLSATMTQMDHFSDHGSNEDDGIGWINEPLNHTIDSSFSSEAECFYINGGPNGYYDYCFFDTTSHRDECETEASALIDCSEETQCSVVGSSNMEKPRNVADISIATSDNMWGWSYDDCTDHLTRDSAGSLTYYVVSKKRARCLNSSDYVIEGFYGGSNWVQYAQDTCPAASICSNDLINITNKNQIIESGATDPCIAENSCTGKVQVITEDSNGDALSNLLVSREGVSNKTTNIAGAVDYNLTKTCGQSMQFSVYCSNSSGATFCGTKSTSLDFNGDYDSLMFDCTVCNGKADLKVSLGGVNISTSSSKVNVNFTIENVGTVSNLNVTVKAQDKSTGLISAENYSLVNINSGDKSKVTTVSVNLNNADFVHVYIDADRIPKVNEPKTNNYVAVPIITDKVRAYVSVDTGLSNVDQAIKDYINLFVIPTSQSSADLKIAISLLDKNQLVKDERPSSRNKKWFVDSTSIYFNGAPLGQLPYTGLVATEDCFLCTFDTVFAIGTDIEGVVASVKRLINARNLYLKNLNYAIQPSAIEKTDTLGLSVYDLMHNPENRDYYRQNNTNFSNVVTKILNDNNYEIAIKTVKTYNDNTTLRLKNVNSDFSQNYKDAMINNSKPVVFAGGAHSNLFRWESEIGILNKPGVAKQLAQEGRNVWEIELTGGPTIDNDCQPEGNYNCPNYKYGELVDYYWPALISGVEQYSGENIVQYVGHSTGCRVALDSLKNWSSSGKNNAGYYFDTDTGQYIITDLASTPVETFIGVGCPGAFNGSSAFISGIEDNPNSVEEFQSENKLHPDRRDIGKKLSLIGYLVESGEPISLNLWSKYVDWVLDETDKQPGIGLSVNKSYLIYGIGGLNGIGNEQDDGLMTVNDQIAIANNIQSSNPDKLLEYKESHGNLPDNKNVIKKIKELLNGG